MKEDTNYYIHYTRAQTWKYMIASEKIDQQKNLNIKYWEFIVGYVNQRTPTKIIAIN
jgi:hypothetical protein